MLDPWDTWILRKKGIKRGGGDTAAAALTSAIPRLELCPIKGRQDQNIPQDSSKVITRKEGECLLDYLEKCWEGPWAEHQNCILVTFPSKESPSHGSRGARSTLSWAITTFPLKQRLIGDGILLSLEFFWETNFPFPFSLFFDVIISSIHTLWLSCVTDSFVQKTLRASYVPGTVPYHEDSEMNSTPPQVLPAQQRRH